MCVSIIVCVCVCVCVCVQTRQLRNSQPKTAHLCVLAVVLVCHG
jgi:hypothetical protein